MAYRLDWEFGNGIAAVTMAFDSDKSNEGVDHWVNLICNTFE